MYLLLNTMLEPKDTIMDIKNSVVVVRAVVLFVLVLSLLLVWWLPYMAEQQREEGLLAVHFLDVGQGDAILIEVPGGKQVLIDGGKDAAVLGQLTQKLGFFDRTLDMVVGTHPDLDHIGGLIDVFKRYRVGTILTTENKGESDAAILYERLKAEEGAKLFNVRRGQTFTLGSGTYLEVLFPEDNPEALESNTSSIVLKLTHGSSTFLFTGDSPKNIEEYLVLAEGEHLKSDVLKVGHHGSRTSTSELFLDEVAPTYAVITVGTDNSYGHPHVEVTDMLFNKRVEVYETAKEGTVTFFSNGAQVWRR
jgi:competence protein ComEC